MKYQTAFNFTYTQKCHLLVTSTHKLGQVLTHLHTQEILSHVCTPTCTHCQLLVSVSYAITCQ